MKITRKNVLFMATSISTIIYVLWRLLYTLPVNYGVVAMVWGVLLLLSEISGFIESLNIYKGIGNAMEPELPDIPYNEYPEIDVFIATYNEPKELLRKTINGCNNMTYPDKNKVHIYIYVMMEVEKK